MRLLGLASLDPSQGLRDLKPIPYFPLEITAEDWILAAAVGGIVLLLVRILSKRGSAKKVNLLALVQQEISRSQFVLKGGVPTLSDLKSSAFKLSLLVRRYLSAYEVNDFVSAGERELKVLAAKYSGTTVESVTASILELEEYKYSPSPSADTYSDLLQRISQAVNNDAVKRMERQT